MTVFYIYKTYVYPLQLLVWLPNIDIYSFTQVLAFKKPSNKNSVQLTYLLNPNFFS